MIKVGSKVKSKSDLNPIQTFSLVSQGIKLGVPYFVVDAQMYLGRNYIKFKESRHWQSEEWFEVTEAAKSGFVLDFDF